LIDIKDAMKKAPAQAIRDIIVNIFLQALDMMFRSPDRRCDDKIEYNLSEPQAPAPDMNQSKVKVVAREKIVHRNDQAVEDHESSALL